MRPGVREWGALRDRTHDVMGKTAGKIPSERNGEQLKSSSYFSGDPVTVNDSMTRLVSASPFKRPPKARRNTYIHRWSLQSTTASAGAPLSCICSAGSPCYIVTDVIHMVPPE